MQAPPRPRPRAGDPRTALRMRLILPAPRTSATPGPDSGTAGSRGVCLSHVMNPPKRSAAVRQSREPCSHHRKYSASASAVPTWSCSPRHHGRAAGAANTRPRRARPGSRPPTTVQYRTPDGSLTRNARTRPPNRKQPRERYRQQCATSLKDTPRTRKEPAGCHSPHQPQEPERTAARQCLRSDRTGQGRYGNNGHEV